MTSPPPPAPKALRLKPTTPLEKEIEGPVCRYAKAKGFYVRKFVSPAHRSVPDRLLISPGGALFMIEFKRPGKTATEAQKYEHQELLWYGVTTYIIDNILEGQRIIDRYMP